MMKILYNSTEIRNAVKKLFSYTRGEKIIIVGFVGEDADYYLPKPAGVKIICWDKEGATNPNGLRALIKKGANIEFENNLHMKLFYVKGRGAIITSANLSKNAFDEGSLKEIGILINSNKIDIKKILRSLNPTGCTDERLRELDKHLLDNPFKKNSKKRKKQMTFIGWFNSPARRKWKLGWAEMPVSVSRSTKEYSLKHYNVKEPNEFFSCKKNEFESGDWALTFLLKSKKGERKYKNASAKQIGWMQVDFVIPGHKEEIYNYEAVEVKKHANPPFIIDPKFRKAFNRCLKSEDEWNAQKIVDDNISKVSERMINSLSRHY